MSPSSPEADKDLSRAHTLKITCSCLPKAPFCSKYPNLNMLLECAACWGGDAELSLELCSQRWTVAGCASNWSSGKATKEVFGPAELKEAIPFLPIGASLGPFWGMRVNHCKSGQNLAGDAPLNSWICTERSWSKDQSNEGGGACGRRIPAGQLCTSSPAATLACLRAALCPGTLWRVGLR